MMRDYLLITGATSGVGEVVARALSSNYNLILSGRNRQRLEQLAQDCSHEVIIWEQDLTHTASIEENLKSVIQKHKISIKKFIHCAGTLKMVPCKMINMDLLEEVYAVNIFSAAMIIKTLISKKWNRKALDSVVFISSNISNRGAKAFSVYGSSKAALDGLMRSLAVELAPNVRINSILPGGMRTKMTESIFENCDLEKNIEKNALLGVGEPSDLVGMIALLLSEEARWITGQQFVIDGGRTIDITE